MGPAEATFFDAPDTLRRWLAVNHDRAEELWIGFHRKSAGKPGISWDEAVDEALCFGWIDSIRKRIDAEAYANRFTRRRPRSTWSAVNIERVAMLIEGGRMTAPGLKAFEERAEARSRRYSYEQEKQELEGTLAERFKANQAAWDFFQTQPPSYLTGREGRSGHGVIPIHRALRTDEIGARRLRIVDPRLAATATRSCLTHRCPWPEYLVGSSSSERRR